MDRIASPRRSSPEAGQIQSDFYGIMARSFGFTPGFLYERWPAVSARASGRHKGNDEADTERIILSWCLVQIPGERLLAMRMFVCACPLRFRKLGLVTSVPM